MKTFLMCQPDYFEVSYVINPWMRDQVGKVDRELAAAQWQYLYDIIARLAHIKLIDAQPGLPDMVFTANAGLVTRQHEVIISSFRHAQRQGESQHYLAFFRNSGYAIKTIPAGINFEGAGDALFDSHGQLWLGSGPRSDAAAQAEIESELNLKIHAVELIDPRWYHLDTAFCPLSNGYALAYAQAFSADSCAIIQRKFGDKVIWVSDEDAINFACNAVCLDHEIILYRASNALKAELQRYHFTVIETDVSEFMKSGGSCKCMTLEI